MWQTIKPRVVNFYEIKFWSFSLNLKSAQGNGK